MERDISIALGTLAVIGYVLGNIWLLFFKKTWSSNGQYNTTLFTIRLHLTMLTGIAILILSAANRADAPFVSWWMWILPIIGALIVVSLGRLKRPDPTARRLFRL